MRARWPIALLFCACAWACGGAATAPPGEVRCGDGVAADLEECDGADLRGKTCESFGDNSGQLACHPTCILDLRACATIELCDNGRDDDGDGDKDCDDDDCADGDACAVCGDLAVTASETCDDGNDVAGDCCDACGAEAGCEREPNDAAPGPGGPDVRGWIRPAGDVDLYSLAVPAGQTAIVTAETHAFREGDTCTLGVDSYLELRTADGLLVGADDDSGGGGCSRLRVAGLTDTLTVAVRASPFRPAAVFPYRLDVAVELAACGD
jgi:hypothetical protein